MVMLEIFRLIYIPGSLFENGDVGDIQAETVFQFFIIALLHYCIVEGNGAAMDVMWQTISSKW
jgi:hypothetical protein